jgi:hypothetical protein
MEVVAYGKGWGDKNLPPLGIELGQLSNKTGLKREMRG